MKQIDKQIEDTLKAFDGMKRATAPDNFEEQLVSRMRFVPRWRKWLQYSAAALLVFGIINVATLLNISTDESLVPQTDIMEEDLLTDTHYPLITFSEE